MNWVDPWGLKTIVIITTDIFNVLGVKIEIGSHAAVYIDNNGDPGLYDPAGSYGNRLIIGYGDFIGSDYQHAGIQGANLTDYMKYHQNTGSRVFGFFFPTTPDEEAKIYERINEMGGGNPFECAIKTSKAITGIGPFKNLGIQRTPGALYRALEALERSKR